MNHRTLLALLALVPILAACYQPVVVSRENDPGPVTRHPFGLTAPTLHVVLRQRKDIGLALDDIHADHIGDTLITLTATNLSASLHGYFEVRCRQFTSDGRQVDSGYTSESGLDAHASQQLRDLYIRQLSNAVRVVCTVEGDSSHAD